VSPRVPSEHVGHEVRVEAERREAEAHLMFRHMRPVPRRQACTREHIECAIQGDDALEFFGWRHPSKAIDQEALDG
jgi:hypothetical protein